MQAANMNSTCPFEQRSNSFATFLATLVLGSIALVTAVANAFVLAAIAHNKKLQTLSNYIIASMAVADFLLGAFMMPLVLVQDIFYPFHYPWGLVGCSAFAFLGISICLTSISHISGIAIDRYFFMTSLAYQQSRSIKHIGAMIGTCWIVSIIGAGLPLFGLSDVSLVIKSMNETGRCKYGAGLKWWPPSLALIFFVIPLLVIIPFYIRIYIKSKRRGLISKSRLWNFRSKARTDQDQLPREHTQGADSNVDSGLYDDVDSIQYGVAQPQGGDVETAYKSSSQDEEKEQAQPQVAITIPDKKAESTVDKREKRVARTLRMVVIVFFCCLAPRAAWIFARAIAHPSEDLYFILEKVTVWIIGLNSTFNPIIYTCYNREFVVTFKLFKANLMKKLRR